MDSAVNDSLPKLLLQRSEGGFGSVLWGREAQAHFGRVFDRLLAEGLLTERAPATTWPPCSTCEGRCEGRDIVVIGDLLVAECPEDHRCNSTLAPNLIRSFEIDAAVLCRLIAAASGLSGDLAMVTDGVWDLGRLPSGRSVMLALDPMSAADPRLVTLIRTRVEPDKTTLLLPGAVSDSQRQHLAETGLRTMMTMEALGESGFALDPAALAPGVPGTVRLIVNRAGGRTALDRRSLNLTDQPFRLLVKLADTAKRHDGFVELPAIEQAIYRDQIRPAARDTRDIVRLLRDGLALGLDGPEAAAARDLIESKRQPSRYRLALTPEEIDIRP